VLTFAESGIHCPIANTFIDPWGGVERAIITHAHADHARRGSRHYLATPITKRLMHARYGADLNIQELPYGEVLSHNGVRISLHPAGHIPGSAQVRLEHKGQVWVVTGDHKREADGISEPFEPLRCDALITECTFGLPVFRWKGSSAVMDGINAWWRANASSGVCSVLSAYSLGKAQRIMAGADASIGPILVHGAVAGMNEVLEQSGVVLPPWSKVTDATPRSAFRTALVIAPGAAIGSAWAARFRPCTTGMASGWMQLRGWRRRSGIDRGFVLSDHADWDALLIAVKESGAARVVATHGYTEEFSRYLRGIGLDAVAESTRFSGEGDGSSEGDPSA